MPLNTSEIDYSFSNDRNNPWDGLGTTVSGAPDSATAIKLANLDWDVLQTSAMYRIDGEEHEIESVKINYRSDTSEPLGVVSKFYHIVQNREAFEFTDQLLFEGVQYESAGWIKGGRRVWLLAHMPESRILHDSFSPYLLFTNGHDGKTSLCVCMTPTRVVCRNTLNIALADSRRKWSMSHHSTIKGKLNDVRHTLGLAKDYMARLGSEAERLACAKLSRSNHRRFIETMFPSQETDRKNKRVELNLERFQECYSIDDLENFKGTKWGLLLAVSDYVTHKPLKTPRQKENHFIRMMEGHKLLDKAYSLILAMPK